MDIIEAIYGRRSVRDYKPDPIIREWVEALVSAAVQAPSAMNLQPWAFFVIEGREALSEYAERAKRHLVETLEPHSPLYHYRDQLSAPEFDIFYGAPLLIVIAATSAAPQSAEDCSMAAQNLMLAAYREGLGTCCIGFARPWLNLPQTKAELGIPEAHVPVLPIVVGYPQAAMPPVPRKQPELHRVRREPARQGEPREAPA
jgi:nitroreductase